MRVFFIRIIILITFTAVSSLFAGIVGSKHDLQASKDGSNDELCAYCHTPNMAKSTFSAPPLWNKGKVVDSFLIYDASSNKKDNSVNSPSMACLGCHDGVSAINSIVNTSSPANLALLGRFNIGTDKSKDHPVSVEYVAGASGLRTTGTSLSDSSGLEWQGATIIADLLRGENGDRVECGSCHDPHMGENPTFLRVPKNAKSRLCLGCHNK